MEYNVKLKEVEVTKEDPLVYGLAECSIIAMNNCNCIDPNYKYTNKEEGTLRVLYDVIINIDEFLKDLIDTYVEYPTLSPQEKKEFKLFFTDNKIPDSIKLKIDEEDGETILFMNKEGVSIPATYQTDFEFYQYKEYEDEKETINLLEESLYRIGRNIMKLIEEMYDYENINNTNEFTKFDIHNKEHRDKFYEITKLLGLSKCYSFKGVLDEDNFESAFLELYIDFRAILRRYPFRFDMDFDNTVDAF